MASPTTAYLDDFGRPRLRESITAFLDVLGFSHTVVTAAEAGQSQQCLDSIVRALNDARTLVRGSLLKQQLADSQRWAIKFFSDNLLVGCPCDEPENAATAAMFVLRCVQRYQLQMALSGFFVRGAVTLGPLCVTDEIIFGTGLIESYQLEAKAAIVPRVVLTEPVMKAATERIRSAESQSSSNDNDLLCRDIDGWWFVNYLQAAVEPAGLNWRQIDQHKSAVLASLSRSPRHEILPKFGWVSRYHNVFGHWHRDAPDYSEQFRIKRVDEESAIERLTRHPEPHPT
jgi:hypothetical protein